MSDAFPLPPHPDLEHYKKRAKELNKICKSGDRVALRAWVAEWIEALVKLYKLDVSLPVNGPHAYTPAELNHHIDRTVSQIARQLMPSESAGSNPCTLARSQFLMARAHGFASWPKFAKHLEELSQSRSPVSAFEAAVDAIVEGDLPTLKQLLVANPDLVQARSTREHRSTLLHYVSANGVEDYRQKTPANIVEIAKLLLKAGADVNAESEAYGGRSTTLGLTATSCHPANAGVQLPLMTLLVDHGAKIDGPDSGSAVTGCLHNGRREAAEFFASRNARLDLESAAGVGRLDVVMSFFEADGSLKPSATPAQLKAGFAWACAFGRTEVIEFLLRTGLEVGGRLNQEGGETGLHWAAYEGHVEIVRLLIQRGAPFNVKDKRYDGTPLDWALYAWGTSAESAQKPTYYQAIALLVQAGARVDPSWFESDPDRQRAASKMQADSQMQIALQGWVMPP